MTLSKKQQKAFECAYNKFKDEYRLYGSKHNEKGSPLPCKRLLTDFNKSYYVLGKPYKPSQITFIHLTGTLYQNNDNPDDQDDEISHICCDHSQNSQYPSCIELTHYELESHKYNCSRKKCHSTLKQYIKMKQPNQYTKDCDKIKPGPFYISNIPQILRKYGLDYNNNKKQSKPKRKYKKRNRKTNQNNSNYKQHELPIVCNHDPKCFINIGQI